MIHETDLNAPTPYFYVILHKNTNKRYAGCRFKKNCKPSEFMQRDGYFTSSKSVRKLINAGEEFEIQVLLTEEECGMPVLEFETLFLCSLNCAADKEWFNLHNNDKFPAYGSEAYKKLMETKYGISNPMQSKEMIQKISDTYKSRTGYDWPMQNPETKEKSRNTCMETTGFEFSFSNPLIREKAVATNKNKTGYDYPLQDPNWAIRYEEKTGYKHPQQNPEIQEKTRVTCKEKTGYEYPAQVPNWNAKWQEKTGYINVMQNPETIKKTNETKRLKTNRQIVLDIKHYLKLLNIIAKDLNLNKTWAYSTDEVLEVILKTLKSKLITAA